MSRIKKIFTFCLIMFLFYSLTKNFLDYQKNFSFYNSYKDAYEKEKKKNITLKTKILKESDPYELEKTIREKLNLLRPGEVAIIIPSPTPIPTTPTPSPMPNYKQWFSVLF